MLDLSNVWPEWRATDKVGEGSYGKVYRCVRNEYGIESVCAIKVISIPQNDDSVEDMRFEGLSEAASWAYLNDIVTDFSNEKKVMEMLLLDQNMGLVLEPLLRDWDTVHINGCSQIKQEQILFQTVSYTRQGNSIKQYRLMKIRKKLMQYFNRFRVDLHRPNLMIVIILHLNRQLILLIHLIFNDRDYY